MKKKNLAILVLLIFGIAYLFFDWQTSGMLFTDYITHCIDYLGERKEGVIAVIAMSLIPIASFFGITIKKEVAQKLVFKLLYIFGIDPVKAPGIAERFLAEQEQTIRYKTESMARKILDSKGKIFDLERKLRSTKLLNEDEFNRAKELLMGEVSWLETQGVDYISKALELVFGGKVEDEN
jgi:hypothetical protein